MPIYEYHCDQCGQNFEELKLSRGDCEANCPRCNTQARRLISHSGFILKGTGWYATDYKNAGSGKSCSGNGAKPPSKSSDKAA